MAELITKPSITISRTATGDRWQFETPKDAAAWLWGRDTAKFRVSICGLISTPIPTSDIACLVEIWTRAIDQAMPQTITGEPH